ncbi:signal recognition particle subunit SRP9 [Plasmodium inui San Antonio 1]|uniref:Signal recognition particle subunit SRP9 n=1 Tax=Plasmodium inui San Antonio 1 TaxID=1237626 RepID=W7A886_9APIC|nr:signal recognition particle subunit SRP9 [Plasmodium inui San Antonio 1]EUD65354.1 signal recognition particle subunit SRP9 [Plasmodium inui San Antonio 1]
MKVQKCDGAQGVSHTVQTQLLDEISNVTHAATKTRYVIKLHRPTEAIILKVTDNKNSIMYRLSKNDNLKRIEELNSLFLMWSSSENANEAFPLKLSRSADKTTSDPKAKKGT